MQFPFAPARDREFDVVGFGTNAVDHLIQVPQYPDFNSKIELTGYTYAAGGEVATTVAGLQRLGLKTAYAGRFGDDEAGRFGLRSLQAEGVDLSYAEQVAGARTQTAFILIDQRSGERTVIWKRDEKLSYTAAEAPLPLVERSGVLHFTPHDVDACLAMARKAHEAGTIVSADVDDVFDGADELFSLVDVFIASADFPQKMFGEVEGKDALVRLHDRYGCGVAGLTLGERGSVILCDGRLIETTGYPVPGGCMDTTGAGDAFRVGLIYGMLKGESVEDSARIANAVAALKCRAVGARTALPIAAEVDDLIKG